MAGATALLLLFAPAAFAQQQRVFTVEEYRAQSKVSREDAMEASEGGNVVYHYGEDVRGVGSVAKTAEEGMRELGLPIGRVMAFAGGERGKVELFINGKSAGSHTERNISYGFKKSLSMVELRKTQSIERQR